MQKVTVRYRRKKRYRFSLGWTLKLLLWLWVLRVSIIPSLLIFLLYKCSV